MPDAIVMLSEAKHLTPRDLPREPAAKEHAHA
jgi:hypothetical protein